MRPRALNGAIVLFASTTAAISLSNFNPKVQNLPANCDKIYESQISGCQASDFAANGQCSQQCINGLINIAKSITSACQNVDVPETSIIGVALIGQLIPALCNGVQVTTIGASSTSNAASSAPPLALSTQASSTSSAAASSSTAAASSSTAVATSTAGSSTTTAASQQSTNINNQSSATSAFGGKSSSTTSSTKSTKTGNSQKSNKDSGGGSPFDVQAVDSASSNAKVGKTLGLVIAISFLAWLA